MSALNILCAQLTRDLFAIAKFLFVLISRFDPQYFPEGAPYTSSKPSLASHCRVLPPGGFNGMIPEPFLVYSESLLASGGSAEPKAIRALSVLSSPSTVSISPPPEK